MQFQLNWTRADGILEEMQCSDSASLLREFKVQRRAGSTHIVAQQIGDEEDGSEDEILAYYDEALGDI